MKRIQISPEVAKESENVMQYLEEALELMKTNKERGYGEIPAAGDHGLQLLSQINMFGKIVNIIGSVDSISRKEELILFLTDILIHL